MKTMFLFGGVRLVFILSHPRGMVPQVATSKLSGLHNTPIKTETCCRGGEQSFGLVAGLKCPDRRYIIDA